MHEHSFIQAIISNIENKDNVEVVVVEVGELAGIEGSHLKEHLVEGTGWEVEVEEKKSRVKCECGYEGQAEIKERLHDLVIFACPKCGKIPEVLEGKDIKILKVRYR